MERAYAVLTLKTADRPTRRITGVATTPAPDRQGDMFDPLGAIFTNPIPLLLHHDKERPIGLATLHPATADGITFDATIATVDAPGPLRERTDDVWQQIEQQLLRGASIGYRARPGGVQFLKDGARRFSLTEICELSLVTVAANRDATIHVIKSLDAPYLAAPGRHPSGDSDHPRRGPTMTVQERIKQFENSRAAKVAAMQAIMDGATEATLPQDKRDEYDTLALDVKGFDEHLARERELERVQRVEAVRVAAPPAPGAPAVPVVRVKSNLAPGTPFVRAAMAILATRSPYEAIEWAKRWDKETPEVGLYLKAAVAPGTTTDPAWAGPLAAVQNVPGEFIELLRPATILGKIPNLRHIPFNAQVPVQTAGGSYGWVGQGAPKTVTSLQFGSAKLDVSKACGIVVLTDELVRLSTPAAEEVVRTDMVAGIAAFLDQQFIDPAVAAVANVHPASITNGLTPITSTGSPMKDLLALLGAFSAAHVPLAGATLILSEANALAMAFTRYPGTGAPEFPGVTATGGTVQGLNVVTSSVAGTNVILVWGPAILYADDGGVTIDVSKDASVQMNDAPDNPAVATTVLVSLWQNNLVGLRAERYINWKRAVNAGVAIVTGATYTLP